MARRYGQLLAAQLLMSSVATTWAAEGEPETFVSLQMENDFFASSGDRYYTHGTQLALSKKSAPPAWLGGLAAWLPLYQAGEHTLVNYTLGQKIFTPNNTEATAVADGDRPYAGYLYVGAALISNIKHTGDVDHGNLLEVTLGVVGPSARSKESQTGIHDLINIDSPQGWDNQLHDELALGATYSRFWRLVQPATAGLETGVSPHATLALGNVYTYAAGGVMFRLGSNLSRDLGPPNIRPGFPGQPYFRVSDETSWYFFLGWESRLVVRDIFLDGNTFKDSHRVQKEPLVGDMQYGLVYLRERWRVALSNMMRTPEFKTQDKKTRYGSLNISRAF